MPTYCSSVASTTERTASRNAADGAHARTAAVVFLVRHLVEGRDRQPLGWRGDAPVDTLRDHRAGCQDERPELGVVELVVVEHREHLSIFVSIESGRQGSALVARTGGRARVPVDRGVVGGSEQLPLSPRRIDFGGCGGPEPMAVVDVDQEQPGTVSGGDAPSPFRHLLAVFGLRGRGAAVPDERGSRAGEVRGLCPPPCWSLGPCPGR